MSLRLCATVASQSSDSSSSSSSSRQHSNCSAQTIHQNAAGDATLLETALDEYHCPQRSAPLRPATCDPQPARRASSPSHTLLCPGRCHQAGTHSLVKHEHKQCCRATAASWQAPVVAFTPCDLPACPGCPTLTPPDFHPMSFSIPLTGPPVLSLAASSSLFPSSSSRPSPVPCTPYPTPLCRLAGRPTPAK